MLGSVIAVIMFHLLQVLSTDSHRKDKERDAWNHPPRLLASEAEPTAWTGNINMWSTKSVGKFRSNPHHQKRRDVEQGHF
jgi:hypothetical protein